MDCPPEAILGPPPLPTLQVPPPSAPATIGGPSTPPMTTDGPSGSPSTLVAPVLPGLQTGLNGPRGPAGPPGAPGSNTETLIAGETVSGHRVVASQNDGTVQYASNTVLADASRQLWLTLGAAIEGDSVDCLPFGHVTELGWSWTDAPIFLGAGGVLTQTPPQAPGAVFFLQVAAPDGPTALIFNPRNPFQL